MFLKKNIKKNYIFFIPNHYRVFEFFQTVVTFYLIKYAANKKYFLL